MHLRQRRCYVMDLIIKRIQIIGSQQNGPEYLYEALDYVAQGKVKSIRSEEHTSELQSLRHLVCRLLLEKKKRTHRQQESPIGFHYDAKPLSKIFNTRVRWRFVSYFFNLQARRQFF